LRKGTELKAVVVEGAISLMTVVMSTTKVLTATRVARAGDGGMKVKL
jgi:hypothetical protein